MWWWRQAGCCACTAHGSVVEMHVAWHGRSGDHLGTYMYTFRGVSYRAVGLDGERFRLLLREMFLCDQVP
jgi:hypothetical protein